MNAHFLKIIYIKYNLYKINNYICQINAKTKQDE